MDPRHSPRGTAAGSPTSGDDHSMDATDLRDQSPGGDPRDRRAPLYDARFEHDACGVGFVADAGGRSGGKVLPLALAGLSALAHRGAFGADGESSDGAGISVPLDPTV